MTPETKELLRRLFNLEICLEKDEQVILYVDRADFETVVEELNK